MYTRTIVKSLILPSISIGVVRAEGKVDENDATKKLVRPRDLALYVDPPKCVTCSTTAESDDGFLLTTIRCARQELQSVLEQAKVIRSEASSMLENVRKETSDAVSYLQQDENLLPRMGAIGFGAFAGYILAVRKGILKKMLYSAAGAGAIAAVAYPNEAREYSDEALNELKKYAVIGYHFVNGADVDWKKLNERMRGLEKNRVIEGRWHEPFHRHSNTNSSSKLVQSDTEVGTTNTEESSQVKPENNTNDASQCITHTPCPQDDPPLPQDRPKAPDTLRQYKSYSEECKSKLACVRKGNSDYASGDRQKLCGATDGSSGGVCMRRKQATSGTGGQGKRSCDSGGRIAEPGRPPMHGSQCVSTSDGKHGEHDMNQTRIEPSSSRPSTSASAGSLPGIDGQTCIVARRRATCSSQPHSAPQQCILDASGRQGSSQSPSSNPFNSSVESQPGTQSSCSINHHGPPQVQKDLPIDEQLTVMVPRERCSTSFISRDSSLQNQQPQTSCQGSPSVSSPSNHTLVAPPDSQMQRTSMTSSTTSSHSTCLKRSKPKPVSEGEAPQIETGSPSSSGKKLATTPEKNAV